MDPRKRLSALAEVVRASRGWAVLVHFSVTICAILVGRRDPGRTIQLFLVLSIAYSATAVFFIFRGSKGSLPATFSWIFLVQTIFFALLMIKETGWLGAKTAIALFSVLLVAVALWLTLERRTNTSSVT